MAVDVMYRRSAWIEDRLSAVIDRAEAQLGYSTCLWHNVATSRVIVDHRGWFKRLQLLAGSPFPDRLVHSIWALNAPMIRGAPLRRSWRSWKPRRSVMMPSPALTGARHSWPATSTFRSPPTGNCTRARKGWRRPSTVRTWSCRNGRATMFSTYWQPLRGSGSPSPAAWPMASSGLTRLPSRIVDPTFQAALEHSRSKRVHLQLRFRFGAEPSSALGHRADAVAQPRL